MNDTQDSPKPLLLLQVTDISPEAFLREINRSSASRRQASYGQLLGRVFQLRIVHKVGL